MICNLVHLQLNDFNGGLIHYRLSTSQFDVILNGDVYSATGDVLKIDTTEDTGEVSKTGLTISLSGIDPAIQADIDAGSFVRAPIDIYIADVPDGSDTVSSYNFYHRGYCDTPITEMDYNSGTISIQLETTNVFTDIDKIPNLLRSSLASHSSRHANDKFFEYVADIDITEIWKD